MQPLQTLQIQMSAGLAGNVDILLLLCNHVSASKWLDGASFDLDCKSFYFHTKRLTKHRGFA